MRLWIPYVLLTFAGPLFVAFTGHVDFAADWRTANRESAHIAPDPAKHKEAVIQVYKARTYNWRGLFAVHTWIAVKPKDAKDYFVLQVVGWRLFANLPPLMIEKDIPDRLWFNHKPIVIKDIRGAKAEKLIPKLVEAAKEYPYGHRYGYWPGPNSNTFTAHVARAVPELRLVMPSDAVGKDFLTNAWVFTHTPSGTGYEFSLFGIFGAAIGGLEGLEVVLLGLTYGFSYETMTLKLPGFGDIPLHFKKSNGSTPPTAI